MFLGCSSLQGTVAYDKAYIDISMANPQMGYFKKKKVVALEDESYVHLSADETVLTFYYDSLRAERDGTSWGIEDKKEYLNDLIPAWVGASKSPNTSILTAVFDASFRDFRPTTTAKWLHFFKSLKHIEGLGHLNTSQVTDMSRMFGGCKSLTSLDLSSFDTSKVEKMEGMFSGCSSLTALDLSYFNTSQVTSMSSMFSSCSSLPSLDLSSFDTSKVENMSEMFRGCSSLTSLDLSSFDTSNVTHMSGMFFGCKSLTSLDLSNFRLFRLHLNLKFIDERDLDLYTTNMFSGCSHC